MLAKSGSKLGALFNIFMPMNYPNYQGYKAPTEEEVQNLVDAASARLDEIAHLVSRREKHAYDNAPNPFPLWMDKNFIPLILFVAEYYPSLVTRGYLYATAQCTACGVCERVCPANRITVARSHEWDEKRTCYSCTACLNYCPTAAVQVASTWYSRTSYTRENGRYPHPFASVEDIARQKTAGAVIPCNCEKR